MPLIQYPDETRAKLMNQEHLRLFPTRSISYNDPFLFLDHFAIEKPMGFPDHPHRGFEIITYVLQGALAHADSAGHESVIQAGGMQKVTAGRGIVHSEMPATDGVDSGLQLWINLPRAEKNIAPEYLELSPDEIPFTVVEGARIRHIAGGPSSVHLRRKVTYQDVEVDDGAVHHFDIPAGYQGFFYVLEGEGRLAEERLSARLGDLFFWTANSSAVSVPLAGLAGFRLVCAIGEPIGERPIFNGPFVD